MDHIPSLADVPPSSSGATLLSSSSPLSPPPPSNPVSLPTTCLCNTKGKELAKTLPLAWDTPLSLDLAGVSGVDASHACSCSSVSSLNDAKAKGIAQTTPPFPPKSPGGDSSCGAEYLGFPGESTSMPPSPLLRAKSCDVYVGLCTRKPSTVRFVNWLRAELELQGISCFVSHRHRRSDATMQISARMAMEAAALGVVLVTRGTFSSPHSIGEVKFFSERRNLLPIFFGLAAEDCLVTDIVERRGELWRRRGGCLWTAYGGLEEEWKDAVNALACLEHKLEANAGNWRDSITEAVIFAGRKLGRRSVVERMRKWKEWVAKEEFPFPRNDCFIGRQKEMVELAVMLFGYVEIDEDKSGNEPEAEGPEGDNPVSRKGSGEDTEVQMPCDVPSSKLRIKSSSSMQYGKGVACVSGDSGIGKTDLLLEFAYRHFQKYKMVLWVSGEARYIHWNFIRVLALLGVDQKLETEGCQNDNGPVNFKELEDHALGRLKRELMRGIPFLLVIDNLEGEKDWWKGRSITDFLPRFGGDTHIIISTTLPQVTLLQPLKLLPLSESDALFLMAGNLSSLSIEEVNALEAIKVKLGGITLGLVIIRAILFKVPIRPQKLLDAINRMPMSYRHDMDDLSLNRYPFLIQLLDVCMMIFNIDDKGRNLTSRMLKTSCWFAPAPIPISLLYLAAHKVPQKRHGGRSWRRWMYNITHTYVSFHAKRSTSDAAATLVSFCMARRSTDGESIQFHDIIRLHARKRGDDKVARVVIQAINSKGSLPHHSDHVWAACFMLFVFGNELTSVDLKISELVCFIERLVVPLALECFTNFWHCSAATTLLGECMEKLENIEDAYLSKAQRELERQSCCMTSTNKSSTEFDPSNYQEFALLRASLLETSAKLMLRGGKYDSAEHFCRRAINIKEVFFGWEHPELISTRKTMEKLIKLKLQF